MVSEIFIERERFKRSFKTLKISEFRFGCSICMKMIKSRSLYVIDSRNDKYCTECADVILNHKIHRLKLFKNEIRDKGILNELEEEDEEKNG